MADNVNFSVIGCLQLVWRQSYIGSKQGQAQCDCDLKDICEDSDILS